MDQRIRFVLFLSSRQKQVSAPWEINNSTTLWEYPNAEHILNNVQWEDSVSQHLEVAWDFTVRIGLIHWVSLVSPLLDEIMYPSSS